MWRQSQSLLVVKCSLFPCHSLATCRDDETCSCRAGYTGDGRINCSGKADVQQMERNIVTQA